MAASPRTLGAPLALLLVMGTGGAVGTTGCTHATRAAASAKTPAVAESPEPPRLYGFDEFQRAGTDRAFFIGGQPSEAALDGFKRAGGTAVINLRAAEEKAFLPYYRDAIVARGLAYREIEVAGPQFGPQHADDLDRTLGELSRAGAEGPVLLHCASGQRATYVYAAGRIRTGDLMPEEAVRWAAQRRGGEGWEHGESVLRATRATP